MKKRNLISVILVVALLLSCSLSVLAAVPPKGETAEPQYDALTCERCGGVARVVQKYATQIVTVQVSSGSCPIVSTTSHKHELKYEGTIVNCANCGKYLMNAVYKGFICKAVQP